MSAGRLRHVIEIERRSDTISASGQPVVSWALVETLRAELVEQEATETLPATASTDEVVVVFRCRAIADIRVADRVRFRDRLHQVRAVMRDARDRWLEVRTVTAAGEDLAPAGP